MCFSNSFCYNIVFLLILILSKNDLIICVTAAPGPSLLSQLFSACSPAVLSLFSSNTDPSEEMDLALVVSNTPLVYKHFKLSRAVDMLTDENFNTSLRTVIIVHGYMDSPEMILSQVIVNGYYQHGGYNIIAFDTKNEELGIYFKAVNGAPEVGKKLGNVLYKMFSSGFDIGGLELVSHSLGSHISGFAGKIFYGLANMKLPTIVALDPAGPCYTEVSPSVRLNQANAEFVQVIHTNGEAFGLVEQIGHVDVYVNGGRMQPDCSLVCSHIKAVLYWSIAVKHPTGFIAHKCKTVKMALSEDCNSDEKILVGPAMDISKRGIYSLVTSPDYPFLNNNNS